jgi:hypothetical protein
MALQTSKSEYSARASYYSHKEIKKTTTIMAIVQKTP